MKYLIFLALSFSFFTTCSYALEGNATSVIYQYKNDFNSYSYNHQLKSDSDCGFTWNVQKSLGDEVVGEENIKFSKTTLKTWIYLLNEGNKQSITNNDEVKILFTWDKSIEVSLLLNKESNKVLNLKNLHSVDSGEMYLEILLDEESRNSIIDKLETQSKFSENNLECY